MEARYTVVSEWLSIAEVARELGMDYKRVLAWTRRKDDPLPARFIDGNKKQARVYRPTLNEWLFRNSVECRQAS